MTLRTAFQMDPMESVNINGDGSFALMLEAQERGYEIWHYDVKALTWRDERLLAFAHPVEMVQREAGNHFRF